MYKAANEFTYEDGSIQQMYNEAVQIGAMAVRFINNFTKYVGYKSDQMIDMNGPYD